MGWYIDCDVEIKLVHALRIRADAAIRQQDKNLIAFMTLIVSQ
jgi:hypothetical protein